MTMHDQQPVPATIRMELKDALNDGEGLISLSTTLHSEGLILREPSDLRRNPDQPTQLDLICTFVDSHTAGTWLQNPAIKKYFGEIFAEQLVGMPETIRARGVLFELDSDRNCGCEKWPSFILQPDPIQSFSPVICGGCLSPISTYRITPDIPLEPWARIYERVYWIWLDSGTLESWAETELEGMESELNREAVKITSKLAEFYSVEAYFSIWTEDPYMVIQCPCCGNPGTESPWASHPRVCKSCLVCFGSAKLDTAN